MEKPKIYLSYHASDNKKADEKDRGWVDNFVRLLNMMYSQLYDDEIVFCNTNGTDGLLKTRPGNADAVLLIAAILSDQDLEYYVKITRSLGMTALVEVHTAAELDRVLAVPGVNLVGINNRNLEDFSVNLETTTMLMETRDAEIKDKGVRIVSESGIHTPLDLQFVREAGAKAVLIGESLVKQPEPQQAIADLFEL